LPDIESIQKTARSFMESRVLLTGVELDLFGLLAEKAMTADQVASALEANLRGTTMLLDALAALGYVGKEGCVYRLEPELVPFLSDGSSDSILPSLRHAANLWHSWTQLTDVVLPGGRRELLEREEGKREKAFIGAMSLRAEQDGHQLVLAVNPGEAKTLLDVGGASGGYTIAFLKAVPQMTATVFDLPSVIEMARERLSKTPWMDRVKLAAGDFYKDDLPDGYDLALVSAIIHMNSHKQNIELYRKVYSALNQGGRVVVRDFVMEPDRTRPVSGALFAINMLVNTDGGGTYTFEEIKDGLEDAGFKDVRYIESGERFSLIEAFKT
jgi:predicted O-methyltransferase YrrM